MELAITSKINDDFKLTGNILMSVFALAPLICIVHNKLLNKGIFM